MALSKSALIAVMSPFKFVLNDSASGRELWSSSSETEEALIST